MTRPEKYGCPMIMGWCFQVKISNTPFAHVLKFWRHVTLQSPNSREKNEDRRYFDYCRIITTEYK